MGWLREWLLTITGAAVIAALADALCPEGFPRRLTRAAGGLLLLVAVLGPLKQVDGIDLSGVLAKYRAEYGGESQALAVEDAQTRKAIIANETGAYISDKAAALGITQCEVKVTCRWTDEGFPAPEQVLVQGIGPDEAWAALSRAITADFALDAAHQTLERKGTP